MPRGSGFTVLIVGEDGRSVRRLSVSRWFVRAAFGLAAIALVAHIALIAHYTSLRRNQVASLAAPAPVDQLAGALDPRAAIEPATAAGQGAAMLAQPAAAIDQRATAPDQLSATREELAAAREQLAQKARTLEPLERRIAEVREEMRSWDGLHTAILKPLAGEQRVRASGVSDRGRAKPDGTVLDAITAVLATVRQESHRLRGLARITRETAEILASVPSRLPLRAAINSGFGMRQDPFGGGRQLHAGIDFAVATGTPVAAAAGGVVRVAGTASGYGNTVVLDHGRGFETRYGHLHTIRVAKGQRVERGQPIGLTGNSGRSTGPHLHYEVLVDGRPVDPRRLIRD